MTMATFARTSKTVLSTALLSPGHTSMFAWRQPRHVAKFRGSGLSVELKPGPASRPPQA
jgi:hypothetical protein